MAREGSSNTAMVIVFMVLILAIAAFFAYRGGYFGGERDVNIDIKVPAPVSDPAPASP